ncbi:hypothetical protein [Chryseobacterium sp. IHB B 17019]|uniref:hypothetical protein n=1 Tax=Chryseobacterium sp. IHB B 17019 TaxID=1721091 RepID=UPI001607076B|nr:hypothetical protein [Chryseobacterium sp. IHB B 17019]
MHDWSINDQLASRRFFKCDDVFSLKVYAKLYRADGVVINFRILSIIYDEKKALDISLDEPSDAPTYTPIESLLLGYSIENDFGSINLMAVKPSDFTKIDIYVKDIKTSIAALTNMAYDSRNVMADQIVNKKLNNSNNSLIPFRRMNVFGDDIYVKHPTNNTKLKVINIYRPAELAYSIRTAQPVNNIKWFVTATPVDIDGKNASGHLYYIPNPRLIEK